MKRDEILTIGEALTETAYEVFTIATEAIMKADPDGSRLDPVSIREGLEAAIKIIDLVRKEEKLN